MRLDPQHPLQPALSPGDRDGVREAEARAPGIVLSAPTVLVVIPAFNEAASIEGKLRNTLALDYPHTTIAVVDDHSTDATYELAARFAGPRLHVLRSPGPPGKNAAVAAALRAFPSALVCVTDADVLVPPDALGRLVARFDDPTVGIACPRQAYVGETAWTAGTLASSEPLGAADLVYDLVRAVEDRLDSIVGPHGQFMVVRRRRDAWPEPGIRGDDVEVALRWRAAGFRARYVRDVRFFERIPRGRAFWAQRYRRGAAVQERLIAHARMLFAPRYGWFGVLCLPLEWGMFIVQPLAVALVLGVALVAPWLRMPPARALAAQLLAAAVVLAVRPLRQYVAVNAVLLAGLWRGLRGRHGTDRWDAEHRFDPS